MTTALEGGEGSASRTGRSLPPGKFRYPLYKRLFGPQGRSGQVRKISPQPGEKYVWGAKIKHKLTNDSVGQTMRSGYEICYRL